MVPAKLHNMFPEASLPDGDAETKMAPYFIYCECAQGYGLSTFKFVP